MIYRRVEAVPRDSFDVLKLPMACRHCDPASCIATALAKKLGVDVCHLPVVVTAPEAAMEKAVSIGTWAVAIGPPAHVGVIPPVTGSPLVVKVLTETPKELLDGYFIVEPDPTAAAQTMMAALDRKQTTPP